jgi:hypothetical protein
MKLTVLASVALAAAVTAGVAAQGGSTTEQTIMGCVKGDGTDANPWMLVGVVIPPPPPPPPPGPPGGGRGGGGRGGGAPAAGAPPPAGGAPPAGAPAGGPPAEGRGARGAAPPAAPPPPPPPPQDFKLTGVNMTPWNGMRAAVTGAGTTSDFKVSEVRSMWGTCKN